MKIQPKWWIAVVAFIIYNAIIYASWYFANADYTNMTGPDVVLTSVVIPLILGAVFVVIALSYLGWWRPVLFDEYRAQPLWLMFPIVLIALAFIAVSCTQVNWSAISAVHLLFLIIAAVLVGFNEEIVTRGMLVVGFRGHTSSEITIWFWSSILFGIMHLPNAFFGLGEVAGVQVIFAFIQGSAFYITRRVSGTLIVPMVLHAMWDFSTFAIGGSGAEQSSLGQSIVLTSYGISILATVYFLYSARKNTVQVA